MFRKATLPALAALLGFALCLAVPTPAASVEDVVTKALAFKAMLNSTQQATLQQTFTTTLAKKWSNLPCGATCRNGVQFSSLTALQVAAAMEVVQAAAGTSPNEGYQEFVQTRWADSILVARGGGNNYGSGIFFLAFLNAPSTTGAWMLQFGGHHFAVNIAYNNGQVVGVTPDFKGVEPLKFPVVGQTDSVAPLNQEQAGLAAMFAALDATQLNAARTTTTFSAIVTGPNQDANFPATRIGLRANTLSTVQKNLILAAMEPYILDMDSVSAAVLRGIYAAEIDSTWIVYSGSAALNATGNYARIDGPSVFIELRCESGIVIQGQIHYHTIWRDRKRDYGLYLAASSLSGTTALRNADPMAPNSNRVYLSVNAAGNKLRLSLADRLDKATVTLLDMSGRTVLAKKNVSGARMELNIAALKQGAYFVKIEQKNRTLSSKFLKL